jgi:hypothetical protein
MGLTTPHCKRRTLLQNVALGWGLQNNVSKGKVGMRFGRFDA